MNSLRWTYEGPSPFIATQRELQPVRLTLECPEGLPAGTEIRGMLGNFRSFRDSATPVQWQCDGAEAVDRAGAVRDGLEILQGPPSELHQQLSALKVRGPHQFPLCTVKIKLPVTTGSRIVFRLRGMLSPHAFVDGRLWMELRFSGEDAFHSIGDTLVLPNRPGPAARIETRVSASADNSGRVRLTVLAVDALLNPAEGYQGTVELEPIGPMRGLPPRSEVSRAGGGRCEVHGLTVTGDRPVRVRVVDRERGFESTSGAILPAPLRGWRHFFGEFHFHSVLSDDGDRDPREAYTYARDYLNLDMVALSDHSPAGVKWEQTLQLNEQFNQPGRFVTLPAWEWSTNRGHVNLYLRTPTTAGGPDREVAGRLPYEVAWPRDVVAIPHHTNIRSYNFKVDGTHYWREYDWSVRNERIRLVEVVQGRGNFETDQCDAEWGVVTENIGASVRDALAMGWRIGFVGGTDNHSGYPTRDPQRPGHYIGLTGFLATELTREAIWQAMDQRRTYATSGVPIVCHFEVNGQIMGTESILQPDETARFSARLYGTAPIEAVEIIANGQTVWRDTPRAWDVELNDMPLLRPPVATDQSVYYYLRLRQADGHRAWSSPVWLKWKS